GVRIIVVTDGLKSIQDRAKEGKKLLTWTFFNLGSKSLYKKGDLIATLPVWGGTPSSIKLYAQTDINVFYNKNIDKLSNYSIKFIHNNVLVPPINKNTIVGSIKIENKNNTNDTYTYNIVSNSEAQEAGFISRFFKTPYYVIKKLFM